MRDLPYRKNFFQTAIRQSLIAIRHRYGSAGASPSQVHLGFLSSVSNLRPYLPINFVVTGLAALGKVGRHWAIRQRVF